MKYTDTHRLKTWMNTDISNYLRKLFCLFLTVLLCLSHSLVWAQPQITDAPSRIKHKENITISGVNFGMKEQAAPLLWDDFEWGTDGDRLSVGGWICEDHGIPRVSSAKSNSGTRSAYAKFISGDEASQWQAAYKNYTPSLRIYASYMLHWNAPNPNNSCGGFKAGRITSEYNVYGGAPYISMLGDPPYNWYRAHIKGGKYTDITPHEINTQPWGPGQWHRIEIYFVLSDPPGAENGYANVWVDLRVQLSASDWERENSLVWPVTGVTRTVEEPYLLKTFMSAHMWPFPPEPYAEAWMDDIYVDNTLARIEIGNAATWDACTHREIQIPLAWSDNSITFTANQGSFANGQTAYLYVVDENGNVNEQGYPVSFGSALLGDVDGNGKVDIKDLILVAKDFGKTSGFNPNCDLNSDNKVDIRDLIIVAKNFGKSQ